MVTTGSGLSPLMLPCWLEARKPLMSDLALPSAPERAAAEAAIRSLRVAAISCHISSMVRNASQLPSSAVLPPSCRAGDRYLNHWLALLTAVS